MTIELVGIGAAPGDNTGDGLRTGMGKVNNNFSNSSHAASYLVGTATGQVLLSEDAGLDGGETNWTSGNMTPDIAGGLLDSIYMQNRSGALIAPNDILAAADVGETFWDSGGAISQVIPVSGSYKYVGQFSLSASFRGKFVRVT